MKTQKEILAELALWKATRIAPAKLPEMECIAHVEDLICKLANKGILRVGYVAQWKTSNKKIIVKGLYKSKSVFEGAVSIRWITEGETIGLFSKGLAGYPIARINMDKVRNLPYVK
jgi:hypothetical protein